MAIACCNASISVDCDTRVNGGRYKMDLELVSSNHNELAKLYERIHNSPSAIFDTNFDNDEDDIYDAVRHARDKERLQNTNNMKRYTFYFTFEHNDVKKSSSVSLVAQSILQANQHFRALYGERDSCSNPGEPHCNGIKMNVTNVEVEEIKAVLELPSAVAVRKK